MARRPGACTSILAQTGRTNLSVLMALRWIAPLFAALRLASCCASARDGGGGCRPRCARGRAAMQWPRDPSRYLASPEARRCSARARAALARATSISSARSAVSARTVTRSGKTSANPLSTASMTGSAAVRGAVAQFAVAQFGDQRRVSGQDAQFAAGAGKLHARQLFPRSNCRCGVTTISSMASGSIFVFLFFPSCTAAAIP